MKYKTKKHKLSNLDYELHPLTENIIQDELLTHFEHSSTFLDLGKTLALTTHLYAINNNGLQLLSACHHLKWLKQTSPNAYVSVTIFENIDEEQLHKLILDLNLVYPVLCYQTNKHFSAKLHQRYVNAKNQGMSLPHICKLGTIAGLSKGAIRGYKNG